MNWEDFNAQDRRLVILRVLDEAPGYSANESVLQTMLERFGHCVSREQVKADMRWLTEAFMTELQVVGEKLLIATATQTGVDVARGRASHPGVKRPSPGL